MTKWHVSQAGVNDISKNIFKISYFFICILQILAFYMTEDQEYTLSFNFQTKNDIVFYNSIWSPMQFNSNWSPIETY